MSHRKFVHLHCHSHYSLLDGVSKIPDLVGRVKSLGMNACAITDHGNLFGAVEFYSECKKAGINPIIGYEAYMAVGDHKDKKPTVRNLDPKAPKPPKDCSHLTLLAKNRIGFHNLIKMASIASLDGFYKHPRIDYSILEAHREGIICLSGCVSSQFSHHLLNDQMKEAKDVADRLKGYFGDDFYVEIQNNGVEKQRVHCEAAIRLANKYGYPLVATADAHYLTQNDAPAQEVLMCINTGSKLSDPNRMKYGDDGVEEVKIDQFHICSPNEMYARMPSEIQSDAIRRTQEIADSVDIQLDFKARYFPAFETPSGKSNEAYLRELCEKGLVERYGDPVPPAATERLDHELGIINKMGFASYFLIVGDFVRFARSKGIPCGARGSGVGAIVSYALYLSHVCPIKYELLFERFLDPNRTEAPDIDIDFCQARREEVIEYVKRKYGEESVAQIATFGTMAARSAIRDVARVMDVPLATADKLAKLVPEKPGITLAEAIADSQELKDAGNDLATRPLLDLAQKLEGTNRQPGTHAAGVVISKGPLVNHVPLFRVTKKGDKSDAEGSKKTGVTTQWSMGDIEKVGLLKMDFLGLCNLTIMEGAIRTIAKVRGEWVDIDHLPEGDPETYALLQRGDTAGVFQFESDGIREVLKRMKPDRLDDLIAANALYRPGPLDGGLVDAFIERKHGREKIPKVHPVYDRLLAKTYGVMVFQEQVMQILNQLGDIPLAKAYACIKAISKKKQEVIDSNAEAFVGGAMARGMDQAVAQNIFDMILKFAGYGFNRSHSCAYADIAYKTAFLKAHYRPEFTAALLTADSSDRDSLALHIDDARRAGVDVLPPDINVSESAFTVDDRGRVVFGLSAIRGLGVSAHEVVRARGPVPFAGIRDFYERVDTRECGKSDAEKLVSSGAFDKLLPPGGHRAQLAALIPTIVKGAAKTQNKRRGGVRGLFDEVVLEDAGPEPLPDAEPWSRSELLRREKESLEIYMTGHPLVEWATQINTFATKDTKELLSQAGRKVTVGGLISDVRFMETKNHRPNQPSKYARFKIEDLVGSAECVMWPDAFQEFGAMLVEDAILFAVASVQENRDRPELIVGRVVPAAAAAASLARGLAVKLPVTAGAATIDKLGLVIKRWRGGTRRVQRVPVYVVATDAHGRTAELRAAEEWDVVPTEVVLADVEEIVGPGNVRFMGARRPA